MALRENDARVILDKKSARVRRPPSDGRVVGRDVALRRVRSIDASQIREGGVRARRHRAPRRSGLEPDEGDDHGDGRQG